MFDEIKLVRDLKIHDNVIFPQENRTVWITKEFIQTGTEEYPFGYYGHLEYEIVRNIGENIRVSKMIFHAQSDLPVVVRNYR